MCWLRPFVGQRGLVWNKNNAENKNPQLCGTKKIKTRVLIFFKKKWKMRLLRALVGPADRPGSCSFLFLFLFYFHSKMRWPPRLGRPGAGRCVWVLVVCVLETHNACLKLATQQHLLFLSLIYCCGRCVCVFVVFVLFMLRVPSSQHNSIYYSYFLFWGGGRKVTVEITGKPPHGAAVRTLELLDSSYVRVLADGVALKVVVK